MNENPLENKPLNDGPFAENATATPAVTAPKKPKKELSWKFITILFAILIPIRLFVAEPFLVYGSSMEPNFETGDYLIVDEISYKFEDPKRGDVVVLRPPQDESRHFIKRIVGLPGESITVKGSLVTIVNDERPEGFIINEPYITLQSDREAQFTLGPNEYFVMGDNRAVSYDSRSWGPLPADHIKGKALVRLYPFNTISILPGSLGKFEK